MPKKSVLDELISQLCDADAAHVSFMQQRNTNRWLMSMIRLSGSLLSSDRIADMINGISVSEATIGEYQLIEACRALRSEFGYMLGFNTRLNETLICKIHGILTGGNSEYRHNNPVIKAMKYNPPNAADIPRLMRACDLEIAANAHYRDSIAGAIRTHDMIISIWPFEEASDLTAYAAMSYELLNAGYPLPSLYIYRDKHLMLSSEFTRTGSSRELRKLLIDNLISECSYVTDF